MRTQIKVLLALILALSLIGCGTALLTEDMRLANQGYDELLKGNYSDAEGYLEQALAKNPDNPYAMLNLGVVYENTGRTDQAREMYKKLIALNPKARASVTSEGTGGKPLVEIAQENLQRLQ